MRLTKQQIYVLADDIRSGLIEEANKYKESKEYKEFENTLKDDAKYKALTKVNKALREASEDGLLDLDSHHIRQVLRIKSNYVDDRRNSVFSTPSIPSLTTIENKIVLNTIGIDDLDILIEKVKDSFRQ
jgi:hypothetical protein